MILIAGGTGTLGRRIVDLLTERRLDVRVMTHDPSASRSLSALGVDSVVADIRDPHAVDRAMDGADVVISAATGFDGTRGVDPRTVDRDGNRNMVSAARRAGVGRFVLMSVRGASPDHPMGLMRMKHASEQDVRASGIPWTILRPSAYLETWIRILAAPLLDHGKTRVFGGGRNPINFVAASDVARLVELAVVDLAMEGMSIDVPGPEDLTMEGIVETFERLTGATGTIGRVPLPALRIMSVAARPISPRFARRAEAAVVMDSTDMRGDASDRARRFPQVPLTTVEDVIERDYVRLRAPISDRDV